MDSIPWPAQLGIAGGAVALLVSFLIWFLRRLVTGKLLTAEQSNAIVAAGAAQTDQIIQLVRDAAAEQIANEKRRGDEWKETAKSEQAGREKMTEVAQRALEANRVSDHFLSTYIPKQGDTKPEEASGD